MIDGSKRKKNTYGILLQAEQILKARNIETEIINLFDPELKDCAGCERCVNETRCAMSDDMSELMQKIKDSDGAVLSSPVYMCGVTSRFKTFADRTNAWVHKPEVAGKPMLFVATTAATGLKETAKFFKTLASAYGARRGGFISRSGKNIGEPVKEDELSRFISLLERDKKDYSPAPDEIVMFAVGKTLARKSDGDDNRFWKENDLFDKNYYYACKMNPLKKLLSKFMCGLLAKVIK